MRTWCPAADAELIALLIDSLRAVGLTADDFVIRLSSRNAWQEFFTEGGGDPKKAYEFYQTIDKFEREAEAKSDEKLRGRSGRTLPLLSRVTPFNSSDTKVKAMSSVP